MSWIDAHHHLWDLNAVEYPWLMETGVERFFGDPTPIQRNYLMDEFCGDVRAQGGVGSVHVQVGAQDGWAEAAWIDAQAQAHPDWSLVQVSFADLSAPDAGAQLDRLSRLPSVRGVRQIVGRAAGEDARNGTNALISDPMFRAHLAALGERGLSFDVQLTPALIPAMAELIQECPNTQFALCHAGSPQNREMAHIGIWASNLKRLADLPNVTCKLSGLGMFDHDWSIESMRPIVDICLDLFGAQRVMFGSNFPVDLLYSDYATLAEAYRAIIPEAAQADVFFATANRFYRMEL